MTPAALDLGSLAGALVGAVVALFGGLAAERLRERDAAVAAARLIYGELLSDMRQIVAVRLFTQRHYAAAHNGIDEETARSMEESGFANLRDEDYFMTHLHEFVDFLRRSGNDEVHDELAHILQQRLWAHGLSTAEPLRREAWDAQGAALARVADLATVASLERAYAAVDRAATVMRESEPTILTGEFFEVGMRADLLDSLGRLVRLGRLDRTGMTPELANLTEASEPWPR